MNWTSCFSQNDLEHVTNKTYTITHKLWGGGGPRHSSPLHDNLFWHKANSAYTVLQDDSRPQPVAQGTWIQDRDAQGGWRFEVGEVRQVVQAEATENDPHARAY